MFNKTVRFFRNGLIKQWFNDKIGTDGTCYFCVYFSNIFYSAINAYGYVQDIMYRNITKEQNRITFVAVVRHSGGGDLMVIGY